MEQFINFVRELETLSIYVRIEKILKHNNRWEIAGKADFELLTLGRILRRYKDIYTTSSKQSNIGDVLKISFNYKSEHLGDEFEAFFDGVQYYSELLDFIKHKREILGMSPLNEKLSVSIQLLEIWEMKQTRSQKDEIIIQKLENLKQKIKELKYHPCLGDKINDAHRDFNRVVKKRDVKMSTLTATLFCCQCKIYRNATWKDIDPRGYIFECDSCKHLIGSPPHYSSETACGTLSSMKVDDDEKEKRSLQMWVEANVLMRKENEEDGELDERKPVPILEVR